MANEIRRTGDVRIKLAPEMLARLEAMATAYGMPGATFAAFAIADFINRQDNNNKLSRMAVMDVARNSVPNQEMQERVLAAAIASAQKALAQENLPLDHVETKGAE